MSKKEPKKEKVDLLDEELLKIEGTMDLETIMLKRKRWYARMIVDKTLPRSYRNYTVVLDLDERPYANRIKEVEEQFDATLFREDKASKKEHEKNLAEMKKQLEYLREQCEHIEFTAQVDELKYKDAMTSLLMQIPDDVVEPFNRQKTRLELYKLVLVPIV